MCRNSHRLLAPFGVHRKDQALGHQMVNNGLSHGWETFILHLFGIATCFAMSVCCFCNLKTVGKKLLYLPFTKPERQVRQMWVPLSAPAGLILSRALRHGTLTLPQVRAARLSEDTQLLRAVSECRTGRCADVLTGTQKSHFFTATLHRAKGVLCSP